MRKGAERVLPMSQCSFATAARACVEKESCSLGHVSLLIGRILRSIINVYLSKLNVIYDIYYKMRYKNGQLVKTIAQAELRSKLPGVMRLLSSRKSSISSLDPPFFSIPLFSWARRSKYGMTS